MMDAKLKADWVKALRSGEYEQTQSRLQDGNKFCCLGVFCKIAGLPIDPSGMHVLSDGPAGYKPIALMIGTDNLGQFFMRNDGQNKFKRHTFPEIADYIEANL